MTNEIKGVNRVILLTGASSGIGESFARQLAAWCDKKTDSPKYGLAITGRNEKRLQALADEINLSDSVECLPIVGDLADSNTPHHLVETVVRHWGRLDVLVNNAGYGLPQMFHQANAADISAQIQVDFTAPIVLTRLALPFLMQSDRPLVIQVSSSISTIAYPIFGAYGACKAGLSYFSDSLRRELAGTPVKVCLVEPGPIRTEFLSRALTGLETDDSMRKMVDNWPSAIFGSAERVAADMLKMLERPKSRISVLRRAVWPLRVSGILFQIFPWLGDWCVRQSLKQAQFKLAPDTLSQPVHNAVEV